MTLAFSRIGRERQDEASGLYGVTRQLGSAIGIAVVSALLINHVAANASLLGEHVTAFSAAARAYLEPLGLSLLSAEGAAIIALELNRRATMTAHSWAFGFLGWVPLAVLPALLFTRRPQPGGRPPQRTEAGGASRR